MSGPFGRRGTVQVVASHRSHRRYELTGETLDEQGRRSTLSLLRELLDARGHKGVFDIIAGGDFQFVLGHDFEDIDDVFYVLRAQANVTFYEHVRQVHAADPKLFEVIRRILSEDCDVHVGYIVVELAARGSSSNPSSVSAIEAAALELKDLMIAIGRRERMVKGDPKVAEDFQRLRKDLLRYRSLAKPPDLVDECPDAWAFWQRISKHSTYSERTANITTAFDQAYKSLLDGESNMDLSSYFASRGLQLCEQIGQGGFGVVYRAKHTILGDRAIKIFQPRFFDPASSSALQRFTREASLLELVSHPRIVRFFDAGISPTGTPFIVTAFVHGQSVERLLRSGPVALDEAIELMQQVLEAIHAAHAVGIAHRDIKPSNVMWHEQAATLLDLGSAGLVSDFVTTRLTITAQGTPGYLAPEQMDRPLEVEPRSDLFAAGQMFHQLLTGRLVEPGDLGHHLSSIHKAAAILPIIHRALAPLSQRFGSAMEMREALARLRSNPAVGVPEVSEAIPSAAYLVAAEDVLSALGLEERLEPNEAWVRWAREQLIAPSDKRGLPLRIVRLIATYVEVRDVTWIDQDDVYSTARVVFGLLETITTDLLSIRIGEALDKAVSAGWLRKDEYDAWQPGMVSGSGRARRYAVTPLGKKALAEVGFRSRPPDAKLDQPMF
jgi:hypothetical protein